MVLLLRKLYLYFTKDPEGVHYFSGGEGVSNFFQGGGRGPNAKYFRNPCTYWLFSRRGVSGPPIYLWIRTSHGQCHHNGTIFITVPLSGTDLSGLITDEVFQMIHWYCARLTPSRNTALGSGSFCNSAFFSIPNIHYVNAVSRTISVTG